MELKVNGLDPYFELARSLIDVASGKREWEFFLDLFVQIFDLKAAHLMIFDRDTLRPVFHAIGGERLSASGILSYSEHYGVYDPVVQNIRHTQAGDVHFVNDFFDEEDFLRSPYYLEWCTENDIRDGGSIKLFIEESQFGELIFNRRHDQPLFDSCVDRAPFQMLAPIVSQTLHLTQSNFELDGKSALLKSSVDAYRFPAALYSDYAGLIACNDLWKSSVLTVFNSSLKLKNAFDNKLFKAIGYLNDQSYGKKYVGWDVEELGLMIQFSVFSPEGSTESILLVFAYSLQSIQLPNDEHIAAVFNLTKKETLVCKGLLAGKPPKQIAKEAGISEYTVRDHIKSLYSKTKCNSQVNLIRLLYSIPG